jgi:XTP/dITP diphosphohydrolase
MTITHPSLSTILLATGNAHKASEMSAILSAILPSVRLVTLKDAGLSSPPDEIERFSTFAANARAKAIWCAKNSGLPSIADDSGLCVDALGGRPGVFSARWAGPNATDADRRAYLLAELKRAGALKDNDRLARFICVCTLALSGEGQTLSRTGSVRGRILSAEQGSSGFGYDPLFFIPSLDSTMAQISREAKNRISHRGRALGSLAMAIKIDMQ